MSGKFTHYLITRFNVPVKNWDRDKEGQPTLDRAWMQERLALFTQYCVPTIQNQACDDFYWLVYLDRKTNETDLNVIQQEVQKVPKAVIRLVDDFATLLADIKMMLAAVQTPYVITSRMDNDDGLGTTYIENVQHHFVPVHRTILNFTNGVLYDQSNHILTTVRHAWLNHFGSLIEKAGGQDDFLTVMGYPHHEPPADATVINIDESLAWLKIIHGRNLKSRTYGIPLLTKSSIAKFGLSPASVSISWFHTTKYVINRGINLIKRKFNPSLK